METKTKEDEVILRIKYDEVFGLNRRSSVLRWATVQRHIRGTSAHLL